MKFWQIFLISFVVSIFINLIWFSFAKADSLPSMRQSVVEVTTSTGLGTGVVIAPGTVLTANHVIDGQKSIVISFFKVPFDVPATVLYSDAKKDLAILKVVVPPSITAAHVSCTEVVYGQDLTMIGFPLGMPWVLSKGYMAGDYEEGMSLMDVRTNHGNSGGPVFNNAGEVVGIALAEVGQLPNKERGIGNTFGVFLSTSKFCNWLKR